MLATLSRTERDIKENRFNCVLFLQRLCSLRGRPLGVLAGGPSVGTSIQAGPAQSS